MNYPNLSNSKVISFDIETYDPALKELGPGVYRKDGNVLGISLANEQGFSEYYNLGHPRTEAKEKAKNLKYVTDVLKNSVMKLGTFILYDLDWLENFLNVKVNGQLYDITVAEPLINENLYSYSLESLAEKYCEPDKRKRTDVLEQFCKANDLPAPYRQHIYLMPYEKVKEYAKVDAELPIEIFRKQWISMNNQDLLELFHLEMDLFPLLMEMRKNGVRVSKQKIKDGIKQLRDNVKKGSAKLEKSYGKFNFNSSPQIAKVLDDLGVKYPLTEKNNPNIDKDVLTFVIRHPVAGDILKVKEAYKILNTFFINSVSGHNVNGRIHCSFYPNRTEEYGTKSGRFSSADPNLQQIPSKEETYGKLCRSLFIPEENCIWGKSDYSQIEYRFIAHYAMGSRSEYVRTQYNENPNTDYHQIIMDLTGLNRKEAKKLNYGIAYMMGIHTMHRKFGWPIEQCRRLTELYNREVPFIRETRNWVMQVARSRGFIRTILKRRARVTPEMLKNHKEYSMFNRLIQGSAADLLKKAMRDCHKAGIYKVLKIHLTVHDELDYSIPITKEGIEACREQKHIMENCLKIKVPIITDVEVGSSWGALEECDFSIEQLRKIMKEQESESN